MSGPRLSVGWLAVGASVVVVTLEEVVGFPGWLRDVVRTVELVQGCFIVVAALLIARRYWRNYRQDPSKARLLPRHVVRLGLGTVGITIASCALVISLLGKPFAWYATVLIFPSFTTLCFGLWDMIEWLPTRIVAPGSVSNVRFHRAIQDMEVKDA